VVGVGGNDVFRWTTVAVGRVPSIRSLHHRGSGESDVRDSFIWRYKMTSYDESFHIKGQCQPP
jgi:hypothetical protein